MLTKLLSLFLTLTLLSGANKLFAANYYWVGGGANANWTTPANWSDTDGGAGNFGVPGIADNVYFTTGTNPCIINSAITVAHFEMSSDYGGIITHQIAGNIAATNFIISGGTFNGRTSGNQAITIENLTQTGGTFNQNYVTLTVNNDFNLTAGTFTGSSPNRTITVEGNFTQSAGSFSSGNSNFTVNGDFDLTGGTFTGSSNNIRNITVEGNFTQSAGSFRQENSNFTVKTDFNLSAGNFSQGNSNFTVNGDFDLSSGGTFTGSSNPSNIIVRGNFTQTAGSTFIASKGSFILTGSGNITTPITHTFNGLTFDHNEGITEFRGTSTIQGNPIFHNLQFTSNGNRIFEITNTIKVTNDFSLVGTGNIVINTGSINLLNTTSLNCANTGTGGGGTALIRFEGSGDQYFIGNITSGACKLPSIVIDKPSGPFDGSLFLNNSISLGNSANWTLTEGTLQAGNSTLVLANSGSVLSGTQSLNNLTFAPSTNGVHNYSVINGTVTVAGNLTFDGLSGSSISLTSGSIDAKKDLIINNGSLTNNGDGIISLTGTTDQRIQSNATAGIPNLTINKASGLVSVSSDINVRRTLAMNNALIDMQGKTLTLGTSATPANRGTLNFASGRIYNGTFSRWYGQTSVAAGTDAALFPLGSSQNDNRQIYISTGTDPANGGIISVQHDENIAASNTDFMDNGIAIRSYLPYSWNITTTGLAGGTYDMQISAAGLQINDLNNIRITKSGSVTGAHGTATGTLADATLTRTGIPFNDLGGTFRIGSTESITPLPVELISFNAAKANRAVNLSWETASEKNNDYFIIERSADGRNFEAIGKVKGAGNSNALNAYAFADKNPLNGVSYYRLKQTDFDGKFEYSKIASVMFEGKLESVAITAFPNPAINVLNVSVNGLQGKATLEITDVTGRSLKQVLVNGSETATLHVETLPKGMYQIRVISESGSSVSKFLKQ